MPAIELSEVTPSGQITSAHNYPLDEYNGVVCITIAGAASLLSALCALTIILPRTKLYKRTHILGYFVSLLVSNVIQSTGTVMNTEWLKLHGVHQTNLCVAQAAVKQLGNVGNGVWSLSIALHLFNLLYLRWTSRRVGFIGMIISGWAFLFSIVLVGPVLLQEEEPYFGVSGSWCWITPYYPLEQRFLEYFFEYISAFFSFLLYTAIILRVRGNLIVVPIKDGNPRGTFRRLHLRFVPKGETWRLSLLRDYIDSSMVPVVHQMMWYPIAYTVLIVPISLARLSQDVPHWAILGTAVIYNLQGAVNVALLLGTQRLFPATRDLPAFKPRKTLDLSVLTRHGVTPFVVEKMPSPLDEKNDDGYSTCSLYSDPDMPPPPKTAHPRDHPPPGWF